MPLAQYSYKGKAVTKQIPTPKIMSNLIKWLKSAQRNIPEMPRHIADLPESLPSVADDPIGWYVLDSGATLDRISFEFASRLGDKAYLVIDRKTKF